uniref:Uncharacterized protein n=1 Tax=Candidatus Methanogaster sp. ANME-2c ERB4 TaxID=2759911 RepID=A0A7G9YEI7_9EURY|nr:hypothetical protein NIBJONLA_00038 [Methanosarcinales archaeon ANME-2c ERB4]
MSQKIKFDNVEPEYKFEILIEGKPVVGFSIDAARAGNNVRVAQRCFLTDYDGDLFFTCLDQISHIYLRDWMPSSRKKESAISNCLIFIQKNNEAEVFINIPTEMQIISKRSIEKGGEIDREDIADLIRVEFPGMQMKSDCAVIYIFSKGWRRGLYFDLLPVQPQSSHRTSDLETLFASFHSYLLFPEVHRLEPNVKEKMFECGWFPFIRILGRHFEEIYNTLKNEFPLIEVEMKVVDSFDEKSIRDLKDAWMTKDLFKKHKTVIETAIDRFIEKDYISAIHILYPRIEGLMRYLYIGESGKPTSKKLVDKLTAPVAKKSIDLSLFLPEDFNEYLKQFYFSSFDLEKGEIDLSRHSLAHGVAKEEDFSKIQAFQAILILDQIFYYV